VREVPEAMKPKKIAINGAARLTAVPLDSDDKAASAA
jgi:molecular chaperone IbpA